MTILITNPNYDDTTGYLFHYTNEIVEFAKAKIVNTLHLKRPRLTREEVTEAIHKKKPSLLLFNGHGDSTRIYGDKIKGKEEPIIEEGFNHYLLESKLVYARVCCAAESLGKKATVKDGCFIGYNLPFQFWIDTNWSASPSKDKTAKLFLEPSNELMKSLIDGRTAEEASEKFLSLSRRTILRLLAKKKEPGAIPSIKALWNNMIGQVVLGNSEMKYSF